MNDKVRLIRHFDEDKNFESILGSGEKVFTGKQLNRLFEVAEEMGQEEIVLSIILGYVETEKPATDPDSDYGPIN